MNKFSSYLKKKKPLVQKLVQELSSKYEFASVLGTDVTGKLYYAGMHNISVTPSSICECGFVARVYFEGVFTEYSFNILEEKNIKTITEAIDKLVHEKINVPKVDIKCIKEEPLTKSFKRNMKGKVYTGEEIMNRLKAYIEEYKTKDKRIVELRTSYEIVEYSKMYISKDRDLEQYYVWINPRTYCVVVDNGNMKYAYKGFGCNNSDEAFETLKSKLDETIKLAIELLSATLPVPGTYDIICDPSITGLIVHEAFGHGLEMDQFTKDRAKGIEYMNKPVATPIVNMHDGASATHSAASYFFDDEGVLAQDTKIIDKGTLIGGICDSVAGQILNYKPTGNGRRQSYKRKAYTRMTNTFFEKGKTKLDDMIASIDYGFYISDTNNGMEDPKNWGIQCTALYGREIKNGKFTGKIISPVVMSGYVIDLLMSISAVAKDNFEIEGSGSCGKGYKEWVRVSDGGSSIKCKVKIG